ncbi:MAG: response regulator [Lachnospiraceae bacterium]|nr:response regulator [Lachnospiraceae bacterium]
MKKEIQKSLVCFVLGLFLWACPLKECRSYAAEANRDTIAEYEAMIYDTRDGLSSMEMNAVAQTCDGYIWVGGYSGLYRYDGSIFSAVELHEKIYNIMVLYVDSKDRLWIGTNDNGVFCYDVKEQEVKWYDLKCGLPANAIRSICEGAEGTIYVGTISYLAGIDTNNNIYVYDQFADILNVQSMALSKEGLLGGVTTGGTVFILKDGEMLTTATCSEEGADYTCIGEGENEGFLLGTTGSQIDKALLQGKKLVTEAFCIPQELADAVRIVADEEGGYYLCAKQGLGYMKGNGSYVDLCKDDFSVSVSGAMKDYQGNVWFVSNKQGVMKLSENPFKDIFDKAEIENSVVNAVLVRDDELFVGCDDGLRVIGIKDSREKHYDFLESFVNRRVRHLMKDSEGNIWASTYGEMGLVCITPNGQLLAYNEATAGTEGGRFRSAIELYDGTILAASVTGLSFIRDGRVIHTMDETNGFTSVSVLTMVEKPDGSVMCGTDGDGIYIIRDKKVIDHIGFEDGLESLVVLRIVPCTGGYLYVTSNSISYHTGGQLHTLENFPYNNNYDVYINNNGQAWVMGSAGIHLVNESQLLADAPGYHYTLMNQYQGLNTTLTSNSWTCVDEQNNIYLCCSTGVKKVDLDYVENMSMGFSLSLDRLLADGIELQQENGRYVIPSHASRIEIYPAVLNFSMSNPLIQVSLDGFDREGITLYQNQLGALTYTALPYGDYKFRIKVLSEYTQEVLKEISIPIHKQGKYYEYPLFRILMLVMLAGICMFLTWFVAKYRNLTIIKEQYVEIERARTAAENARAAAEEASQAKTQFLAKMSHEIRTPINTIMGMNEMIMRDAISADVRRHAEDIDVASTALLGIINDILDLSRIESNKLQLAKQEYHTKELLDGLGNMLQVRAKKKPLLLHMNVDLNIPRKLFGDDSRIRQIVLNLLSNAVKYTEEGSITFSARLLGREEDHALIEFAVEDTGIGIRPDELDKLFEPFERLDEKRNKHIEGTGLGLAITQELLHMMGSELKVESTYGSGTRFYFVLKQLIVEEQGIGTCEEREEPVQESYEPMVVAPDARILVVDDNQMNLEVVEALLECTQVQVDLVDSGYECLKQVKQFAYDLIFLDHMMPQMDGLETFDKMRQMSHLCEDTPVVVLTANAIEGAREMYLRRGFADYLSKPVSGRALEEMLDKYLPNEKRLRKDSER